MNAAGPDPSRWAHYLSALDAEDLAVHAEKLAAEIGSALTATDAGYVLYAVAAAARSMADAVEAMRAALVAVAEHAPVDDQARAQLAEIASMVGAGGDLSGPLRRSLAAAADQMAHIIEEQQ